MSSIAAYRPLLRKEPKMSLAVKYDRAAFSPFPFCIPICRGGGKAPRLFWISEFGDFRDLGGRKSKPPFKKMVVYARLVFFRKERCTTLFSLETIAFGQCFG